MKSLKKLIVFKKAVLVLKK